MVYSSVHILDQPDLPILCTTLTESTWNRNKTFTGWSDDADLTEQGTREMEHAARLLMEQGYEIDVVFTSRLKRAIRSVWILLQELNEVYVPVFKSWRINERHYGSLTGLSKTQTAERLGAELVQEWRGSLRSRPPAMTESHPYYPGRERKYADLTKEQMPLTESLLDCMERTIPLWENKIVYELMEGRNVLVVAHANSMYSAGLYVWNVHVRHTLSPFLCLYIFEQL